ncbi:MAG: hypothetical protein AB2700_13875, partial [Candidatus Thiodiazotropha taylori]
MQAINPKLRKRSCHSFNEQGSARALSKLTHSISLPVLLLSCLAAVISFPSVAGWNASDDEDENAAALQLEGDHRRGQEIYESCAVCHMPEGWGT